MFIITKNLFYKKLFIFSIESIFTTFSWISIILFYKNLDNNIISYLYISFISLYTINNYFNLLNLIKFYRNINREFRNSYEYRLWYSNLYINKRISPILGSFIMINGLFFSVLFLLTISHNNILYIFFIQYIFITFFVLLFTTVSIIYYIYLKFCNNNDIRNLQININNPIIRTDNKYKVIQIDYEIECSICLENWIDNKNKEWAQLMCSHVFHTNCINKWFEQSTNCPICRT